MVGRGSANAELRRSRLSSILVYYLEALLAYEVPVFMCDHAMADIYPRLETVKLS